MRKKILIIFTIASMLFINMSGVVADTYDNYDPTTVSCGEKLVEHIPATLPKVVSTLYTVIQVAVPVVLVVIGSLDLFKGISAQKEEEIKKGQQMFIKRLISGALIFFVFVIVKIVISPVADGTSNRILNCTECFINNNGCEAEK